MSCIQFVPYRNKYSLCESLWMLALQFARFSSVQIQAYKVASILGRSPASTVKVLIPLVLWWWKDLSQEVAQDPSTLARTFKVWRLIATGTWSTDLNCLFIAWWQTYTISKSWASCRSYASSTLENGILAFFSMPLSSAETPVTSKEQAEILTDLYLCLDVMATFTMCSRRSSVGVWSCVWPAWASVQCWLS